MRAEWRPPCASARASSSGFLERRLDIREQRIAPDVAVRDDAPVRQVAKRFAEQLEPRLLVRSPLCDTTQPHVILLHRLYGHRVRSAEAEHRTHQQLMNQHRPGFERDGLE